MIFITQSENVEFNTFFNSINDSFSILINKSDDVRSSLEENLVTIKSANIIILDALSLENKAFEVLDWLRIKYHLLCPVIMVGHRKFSKILKEDINYSLILSPGTYYYQTEDEEFSTFLKYLQIPEGLNSIYDLKPYIQNRFDISNFRHSESNIYGLKTLFDIQALIEKPDLEEHLNYPKELEQKIDDLKYYALDIIFPSSTRQKKISDYLNEIKDELAQRYNLLDKVSDYTEFSIDELIDIQKTYLNEIYELECSINELQHYNQDPATVQKFKLRIGELEEEVDDINKQLDTFNEEYAEKESEIFWDNIPNVEIENLDVKNKNVLLIDDQASLGWATVYKKILNLKEIEIIEPKSNQSLDEIKTLVKEKIQEKVAIRKNIYDVILLDLMLFKNENNSLDKNLSGIKILEYLSQNYPFVPVIVTSASNKLWSYKKVLSSGGYAYWMKEGIDSLFDFNASLKNYNDLISIFNKITGNTEFRILKRLAKLASEMKDQNFSAWWTDKNFKWSTDEVRHQATRYKISKTISRRTISDVKMTYTNAVNIYKSLAIDSLTKQGFSKSYKPILDMVVLELVKCVEIVHTYKPTTPLTHFITYNTICKSRGDKVAPKLLFLRNASAHHSYGNKAISLEKIVDILNLFIPYITKSELKVDEHSKSEVKKRDKKNTEKIIEAARVNDKELFNPKTESIKPKKNTIVANNSNLGNEKSLVKKVDDNEVMIQNIFQDLKNRIEISDDMKDSVIQTISNLIDKIKKK